MPWLTAPEFETRMTALAAGAKTLCSKIALPNPTASEGGLGPTTYSYLKIANGTGAGRTTVLVVAGMHALEWSQPDAVISFAEKLLQAYQGPTDFVVPAYTDRAGSTHGPFSLLAATVQRLVDTMDILFVPLANPDGRAFTQSAPANVNWRKNRAPRVVAADPLTVGVDINRNFDIAWDYEVYFSPAAAIPPDLAASKDPADDAFIGRAADGAASQPEVKNIVELLTTLPITYVIDLHTKGPKIMYPWAIEHNGTNPAQTFMKAVLNRNSEYFPDTQPVRLLERHRVMAGSMRDAIFAATGRSYIVGSVADIYYPATGSLTDYAFSRQFTVTGSPPIHVFTAEFGDFKAAPGKVVDTFQPPYNDPHGYPKFEREIHAVLLAFLEGALPAAFALGLGSGGGIGSGGGTGGGGDSGSSSGGGTPCIFRMAAAGLAQGEACLDILCRGRGALLAGRMTRGAMLALERAYRGASAWLCPKLARRPRARLFIAYGILAPLAGVIRLAMRMERPS